MSNGLLTGNRNRWINPPILIPCDKCGRMFLKHLCHMRPKNYCSRGCYRQTLIGLKQSEATRQLRSSKLSGALSPRWRGGTSRQYKRGYKSAQFKRWRTAVFERDHYTCQDCGQVGGFLTAHHIKGFSRYPELRYEVNNGVTLCPQCHAKNDPHYRVKGGVLRPG